jgi:hypothetical protein
MTPMAYSEGVPSDQSPQTLLILTTVLVHPELLLATVIRVMATHILIYFDGIQGVLRE